MRNDVQLLRAPNQQSIGGVVILFHGTGGHFCQAILVACTTPVCHSRTGVSQWHTMPRRAGLPAVSQSLTNHRSGCAAPNDASPSLLREHLDGSSQGQMHAWQHSKTRNSGELAKLPMCTEQSPLSQNAESSVALWHFCNAKPLEIPATNGCVLVSGALTQTRATSPADSGLSSVKDSRVLTQARFGKSSFILSSHILDWRICSVSHSHKALEQFA